MTVGPAVGDKAPDIDLPEAYGGVVSLEDVLGRGPAIIVFYPSDWGIMCTVEMLALKGMYPELSAHGATVLAISTNSVFCHSAWKLHLDLPFPLLADFDGRVSNRYGVLAGEEGYMLGRSKRSAFVVDRHGILRYRWVSEDPALEPEYEEILELVRELDEPATAQAPAGRTPQRSTP